MAGDGLTLMLAELQIVEATILAGEMHDHGVPTAGRRLIAGIGLDGNISADVDIHPPDGAVLAAITSEDGG